MSVAKRILNKQVWAWHSKYLSVNMHQMEMGPKRASVPISAFADPADVFGKGPWQATATGTGAGLEAELALMQALANDGITYPLTYLPTADSTLNPAAVAGDPAAFCGVMIHDVGKLTGQRGQLHEFSPVFQPQTPIWAGKVLLCSVGGAPLGATANTTPVQLGALTAGHVLAGVFHVLQPPGISGTLPTLAPVLQSATLAGFGSPVTRFTPTPYAAIEGSQYFEIDGDTSPISDTWYRLQNTVGGSAGPGYSIIAAIGIGPKVAEN